MSGATITTGVTVVVGSVDSFNKLSEAASSGAPIDVVNSAGSLYSALVTAVIPLTDTVGIGNVGAISGLTAFVAIVKIEGDVSSGNGVGLGDYISLTSGLVTAGAMVGAIALGGLPAIGYLAYLGAISAASGAWATHKGYKLDDVFDGAISLFTNLGFISARTFTPRRDPLAFDLDGDGLETTTISADNTTLFDHDGDGVRTGTGWLKGDDGFLALDRNGNGTIDNGSELFGVDTVLANGPNAGLKARSGFEALADLDSNGDHLFDAQDAAYGNVRMWRDLNQDGISQAEELQTLADAGIASINLNATTTNITLTGGNVLYGMAGNVGDDAYVVDSLADTVLELSGQGTDTVMGPKHFLDAANESNWRSVKCA